MEQHSPNSFKKPFKLFEHSLSQFNDVVIPHRLDMLNKHRGNIEKAIQLGDGVSASREQSTAKILVQNLKRDLSEIEALRKQIDDRDVVQFDRKIQTSQAKAQQAIEEYKRLGEKLHSFTEKLSTSTSIHENDDILSTLGMVPQLQLVANPKPILDDNEEEYVQSWEKLRDNIQDLNAIYSDLHEIVQDQGEIVSNIEENTTNAADSVYEGSKDLERALKYKATTYPVAGALIGALVGGPFGLIIGLKAGGCAAVGGSILGFVGGKFLKKKTAALPEKQTEADFSENIGSKEHQS